MKVCLSGATIMPCTFAQDVGYAADAGCTGLEVWLPKLEKHLESHSVEATRKLALERGITLTAASFQGGLLLSQGEKRKAHFDHFRKRLEICQGARHSDAHRGRGLRRRGDGTSLERSVVSLTQAAQWAAGVRRAACSGISKQRRFCTCLDTAIEMVRECGEANVGINLDVFHYYSGPSKLEDFMLLPPDRLFHVQFCDVAGVPRELATDADRILPGDGDYQLDLMVQTLRGMGYDGWVALELLNPSLWQANPQQVAEIGITVLRKSLGLAKMA